MVNLCDMSKEIAHVALIRAAFTQLEGMNESALANASIHYLSLGPRGTPICLECNIGSKSYWMTLMHDAAIVTANAALISKNDILYQHITIEAHNAPECWLSKGALFFAKSLMLDDNWCTLFDPELRCVCDHIERAMAYKRAVTWGDMPLSEFYTTGGMKAFLEDCMIYVDSTEASSTDIGLIYALACAFDERHTNTLKALCYDSSLSRLISMRFHAKIGKSANPPLPSI